MVAPILATILTSLLSAGASFIGKKLFSGGGAPQQGGRQYGFGQPSEGGFLTRPGQERRFERFTPEQQDLTSLLRNLLTGEGDQPTGGLLGDLFGPQGFESFAAPAMKTYQEEIVPHLAERFSQLGAQKSSGFQQALARSGENLAARLGQMRGQQQTSLLGGLLSQTMAPQFETYYTPGGPTGLSGLLGSIGQGIGAGGASLLGSGALGKLG